MISEVMLSQTGIYCKYLISDDISQRTQGEIVEALIQARLNAIQAWAYLKSNIISGV